MTPELDLQGWLHSACHVAPSPIAGQGLFTSARIAEGELVVRWGGRLLTAAERDAGGARDHTAVAIAEGMVIAALPEQPCTPDDFMNHACDPTLWMRDALTLVARRELEPGTELTADYALWLDREGYVMRAPCHCGSALCRGRVTGEDWRRPELQLRYRGHFSPFLERRIAREPASPMR